MRLVPAGHVLGSAQIVLEYRGSRVVASGDYKRRPDPTCAPFEPLHCDLFITEATFGLPVFRHPPDNQEIDKLLHSLALFPERCHLVGVYALGKCQRVLALLRRGRIRGAGLSARRADRADRALREPRRASSGRCCPRPASGATRSRAASCWRRRALSPTSGRGGCPIRVVAMASGWMRVRQRAKARGVELPLVISDHADWDELTATLDDVAAGEIWVTHGREEALVHYATQKGYRARALALAGFEERRVNRFAALLDALLFTPSRNGKLRLMQEYFASVPDPDRGWALAALTGELSFAEAKPSQVRALAAARASIPSFSAGPMISSAILPRPCR